MWERPKGKERRRQAEVADTVNDRGDLVRVGLAALLCNQTEEPVSDYAGAMCGLGYILSALADDVPDKDGIGGRT